MKNLLIICSIFLSSLLMAQTKDKGNPFFSGGVISVGGRSTISLFNDGDSKTGTGIGGQFRIQFTNNVNSDWFFDYITSPIGNYANRTDYHIGWSVMFYPSPATETAPLIKPYFVVGHCFDRTVVRENANFENYGERLSSAVQGGVGTHINLSRRFDLSLTSQYMIHLGNDINTRLESEQVIITKTKGTTLEGHLLLTLSMNYKIADLW